MAKVLTVGATGDYQTIKDALEAASNGDTIRIEKGDYTAEGDIDVKKAVTIAGAAEGVIVHSFAINSDDVTIKGLTIRPVDITYGKSVCGIHQSGAGDNLGDNKTIDNLTIQNCIFDNSKASTKESFGIDFSLNGWANANNLVITDNTFLGADNAQDAIYGSNLQNTVISNNTMSGFLHHGISAGLYSDENLKLDITGNAISNVGRNGIQVAGHTNTGTVINIADNCIHGANSVKTDPDDGAIVIRHEDGGGKGSVSITGNSIGESVYGINLYSGNISAEVRNNAVEVAAKQDVNAIPQSILSSVGEAAIADNYKSVNGTVENDSIPVSEEVGTLYVNSLWSSFNDGEVVIVNGAAYKIGTNAFRNFSTAVNAAAPAAGERTVISLIGAGDDSIKWTLPGGKALTITTADPDLAYVVKSISMSTAKDADIIFKDMKLTIRDAAGNGVYPSFYDSGDGTEANPGGRVVLDNTVIDAEDQDAFHIGVKFYIQNGSQLITHSNLKIDEEGGQLYVVGSQENAGTYDETAGVIGTHTNLTDGGKLYLSKGAYFNAISLGIGYGNWAGEHLVDVDASKLEVSETVTINASSEKPAENPGELHVHNKGLVTAGAMAVKDYGTLTVDEGKVEVGGTLTNSGKVVLNSGAELTAETISNKGLLVMTGTSTLNSNVTDGYLTLGTKTEQFTGTLNSSELYGLELINGTLDIKKDLLVKGPYNFHIVIGGRNLATPDADAIKGVSATISDGATVTCGAFFVGCGDPDAGDNSTTRRGYYTATVTGEGTSLIIGQPGTESTINVRQDGVLNVLNGAHAKTTQLGIYGEALFSGENTSVEASSFVVYNDDHLAVASIKDGAAVTVSGAVSVGKNKLRNGTLNMDNATLNSGSVTVGCTGEGTPLYPYPAGHDKSILNLSGNSGIVTGKFEVLSTGTVSMDYRCTISASEFAVANGITVNVDGIAGNGLYRIFSYTGSDPDFDFSKLNYSINGDLNGYTVKAYGNELCLSNVDMSSIYVDTEWTDKQFGEEITINGKTYYYGVTAFNDFESAVSAVKANPSATAEFDIILAHDAAYSNEIKFTDSDLFGKLSFTTDNADGIQITGGTGKNILFDAKNVGAQEIVIGKGVTISALDAEFRFRDADRTVAIYGSLVNNDHQVTKLSTWKALYFRGADATVYATGSVDVGRLQYSNTLTFEGESVIDGETVRRYSDDVAVKDREGAQLSSFWILVDRRQDGINLTLKNTYASTQNFVDNYYDSDPESIYTNAVTNIQNTKFEVNKTFVQNYGTINITDGSYVHSTVDVTLGAENITRLSNSELVADAALSNAGTLALTDSTLTAGTITNSGRMEIAGTSRLSGTVAGNIDIVDDSVLTSDGLTTGSDDYIRIADGKRVVFSGNGFKLGFISGVQTYNDPANTAGYAVEIKDAADFYAYAIYTRDDSNVKVTNSKAGAFYLNIYGSGSVQVDAASTLTVGEITNVTGNLIVDGQFVSAYITIYAGKLSSGETARSGQVVVQEGATVTANSGFSVGTGIRNEDKYNSAGTEADSTARITVNKNATLNITGIRGEIKYEVLIGSDDYAGEMLADGGTIRIGEGATAGTGYMPMTVGAKGVVTLRNGASMVIEDLRPMSKDADVINNGAIRVSGSSLEAKGLLSNTANALISLDSSAFTATLANKGTLLVTGNSTLTGAISESGAVKFGDAVSSVDAVFNMTGLTGGFVYVANGSLDVKGTNEESSTEIMTVGGGWDNNGPANGVASGTMNITKDSTLYFNQIKIGDRNDAGNVHTVNIDGVARQRDPENPAGQGGTVYLRYNGVLNVRQGGELVTRMISNGGTMSVDAATVTVNGKVELGSKSTAGERAGQITLINNASMTVNGDFNLGFQDDVLRNGVTTVNGSSLTVNGMLKVGQSDSADLDKTVVGHGILDIVNHGTVTVESITVNAISSLLMDYSSSLIFNSAFTNDGTISVDMTGAAANGLYKLIDSKNAPMTLADYGNVVFKDGADFGYKLTVIDNDLYASKIDASALFINSAWAGKAFGEEVEPGKFYGINAFDSMDKIYDNVENGGVGSVVLSSDVTLALGDSRTGEYNFNFKDDVVIDSDGDVQRVINSDGVSDLTIAGADQSRGSGNTKPGITIGENVRIQSAGSVWFGYYLAGDGSKNQQYLGNYAADITLKGDVELTSGQAHLFGRGTVMTITETGSLKVAGSDIQTRGAKLIVNGTGKDMASAQVQLNHENVEGDVAGAIVDEQYDEAPASWELNNTFVNVNTYFGINTSTSNRASGIEATVSLNSSKLAIGKDLTMADAAKMILSNESEATVGGNVKLGNDVAISKGAEISVSGGSSFTVTGTATVQAGTAISVSDSAFSAGTLDNAGTVAVSGNSTLGIGALTGTVTLADGTVLTATTVSGGTIIAAGSVSVNCEAFSGSVVSVAGTLNITDVVLPSGSDTVTLLNSTVASTGISVNGLTVTDGSFIFDSVKYNVVNHGNSLTVSMDQDNPYTPMSIDGTPVVTQADGTYDFTIDGFSVLGGEGEKTYSVVVRNGDTVVAESNGLSFTLADIPTYDSISVSITVFDKYGESTKLELSAVTQAVADWTAPEIGDYRIEQRAGKDVYDFNVMVDATDNFGPLGLKSYYRYAETPEALNSAEVREVTGTDLRLTAAEAGKTYFYQMMAVDRAGNESAWTAAKSFEVKDVTDPVILGSSVEQSADGYNFTVTADATDNVGVEKIVYRWATTEQGLSGNGADVSKGFTVADNVQNFYYQVQAFDKAGNASGWSAAEKVAVNDVTAPVITGYSITRTVGTYNFTVSADGTDNFGVTEYLYRWAKTKDGLEDSEWLSVTTPLSFTVADAGQTYYYQVMLKDAAGNESETGAATAFKIDQIPAEKEPVVVVPVIRNSAKGYAYSKTEDITGTVSKETGDVVLYRVQNSIASRASITLNGLEKGEKVKISVLDESGKKLKSVTVTANKCGQVVLKDYLTPLGDLYLKVESTVRKGEIDYNMTVEQLYFKPASPNKDIGSSQELLADDKSETTDGWVGYGDEVDTYRISNGQFASAIDFNFTSLSAKIKVTLRDENGKKIKSMTLTAKNYEKKSFSDILLAAGKTAYLFVESTKGKSNLSAEYTLCTSKEEFSKVKDDSMLNRTAAETFVDGVSSNKGWVGYSDAADYYQFEIASSQSVGFDLTGLADGYKAGKQVKVALYNVETGKKVSLSSVKDSSMDWITKKELDAGKYCAVVSIANEKKYRSDYSLNILANA